MAVFEDFETPSIGWSNGLTTLGGNRFSSLLGRFGVGQSTEKTYAVAHPSEPVKISFDFYEIDSWDGEKFQFFLNDQLVFAKSLFNGRNDKGGSGTSGDVEWKIMAVTNGRSDLGFASGKHDTDQKFHVEITINNPPDQVKIGFSSTLDQAVTDEAFGIDNIRSDNLIYASPAAVDSFAGSLPDVIEHTSKIGIGTWDFDAQGSALEDLSQFNFGWYYNWKVNPLWSADATDAPGAAFVPMIWGKQQATAEAFARVTQSTADTLLGFNEPNNSDQANMTVQQAIDLWPQLMATGKRLGSPATTTGETLGPDSWLGQFMEQASAKNYRVDFIAMHYYSDNPDVSAFKAFLEAVHDQYQKPIWVTEWALVDWANPDEFTLEQTAAFAHEAAEMMDDLAFVERHAWFGAYAGGDGWHINTELMDDKGQLTAVGDTFFNLTEPGDPTVAAATASTQVENGWHLM